MNKHPDAASFSYPAMLKLKNKKCVIVGSGPVAQRKLVTLAEAGAAITVISPVFSDEFRTIAKKYAVILLETCYATHYLQDAFLTIAATNDFAVNRQITNDAPCLCNNITEPELGNFTVPASFSEGELTIAVATSGTAAYTKALKNYLQTKITPAHAEFHAFLKQVRAELKSSSTTSRERTAFWRNILNSDILKLLEAGEVSRAKEIVLNAVTSFRTKP